MADRVLRDQCEHGRYEEHEEHLGEREKAEGVRPCLGGREVTIPLGRVIVPAGATLKALDGVRFLNVQLDLQEGSDWKIEGCRFDMTELTALGINFTTVTGASDG